MNWKAPRPLRGAIDAVGLHSLTLLADMPFSEPGHIAISGSEKPVAHQRARLTVRADQRRRAAGLIQQVSDLTEIVHALLAQQRVHVRVRQTGPG